MLRNTLGASKIYGLISHARVMAVTITHLDSVHPKLLLHIVCWTAIHYFRMLRAIPACFLAYSQLLLHNPDGKSSSERADVDTGSR